ncbi:RNA-binding protein [Streptomyces sp. NPDC017179]|uniref:RNA-binding protein n=1 Tax=Streptomyces sp. NPDC017179 TaxID=3364979 RepID=UPI00379E2BAE
MLESFAQVYRLRGSTVLRSSKFPAQSGEPAHDPGRHALRRRVEDEAENRFGRFRIKGTTETCDVRVKRVTEYSDFEALLDGEGPANVNPTATRERQLTNIRAIYPPEKEAFGALAIEIERTAGH